MKTYSLDRFEEDYAVLIDDEGKRKDLKRSCLPASAKEGSVIIYEAGMYRIDSEESLRRRKNNVELKNKLFGASEK